MTDPNTYAVSAAGLHPLVRPFEGPSATQTSTSGSSRHASATTRSWRPGPLGSHRFKVFADLERSTGRGVRGSYDVHTVHLDLTATAEGQTLIACACVAPPLFTALTIAALLFFA
jgi:hypothetical protein